MLRFNCLRGITHDTRQTHDDLSEPCVIPEPARGCERKLGRAQHITAKARRRARWGRGRRQDSCCCLLWGDGMGSRPRQNNAVHWGKVSERRAKHPHREARLGGPWCGAGIGAAGIECETWDRGQQTKKGRRGVDALPTLQTQYSAALSWRHTNNAMGPSAVLSAESWVKYDSKFTKTHVSNAACL